MERHSRENLPIFSLHIQLLEKYVILSVWGKCQAKGLMLTLLRTYTLEIHKSSLQTDMKPTEAPSIRLSSHRTYVGS